MVDSR